MPQNFKTQDRVRLEVEADPVGIPNLIKNPNGTLGAWAWLTPLADTAMTVDTSIGTTQLYFTNAATQAAHFTSEFLPITAGQYVGSRINLTNRSTTAETVRLRMEFFDSDYLPISSGAQSAAASPGAVYAPTTQAPAGAAFAKLRVDVYTSGGNLTAGRWVMFLNARTGQAATATAIDTALAAGLTATTWNNILGPSHEIRIDREELNVGVLSATILDATLDPSTATTIRPGRAVRVTVKESPSNAWLPIYNGVITSARTTYDNANPRVSKRVRITLEAADNVKTLANVSRPDGVSSVADLRAVLEGAGVPWMIDGSYDQIPGAAYFTRNENASALDQIAIVRDSTLGYAWVDRDGVLNVYSQGSAPVTVAATLTASDYTALDVDFDTQRCINTVTVKLLRKNAATGETVEVPHGPFVDQASVNAWGPFAKEFTVQGLADDSAYLRDNFASYILAANATPTVRVNSLTFQVKETSHFTTARALLDLYDRVSVVHNVTDDSRITSLSHTITPTLWTVTLGFSAEGGVAAPSQAPALATTAATTLPADLTFNPASQGGGAVSGWNRMTGGAVDITEPGVYLIQFTGVFGGGTVAGAGRRGVGVATTSGAVTVDGDMVLTVAWANNTSGSMTFTGFKELPAGASITPWRYNDISGHYSAGGGFLRAVKIG